MSDQDVVRISVYIKSDLKQRIQKLADEKGMTMNGFIIRCLSEHVEDPVSEQIRVLQERVTKLENEVESLKKK